MITRYQLALVVIIVIVAIVTMNPSYYRTLQSLYRTLSKVPKVVILIVGILTAIGIKVAIPRIPFELNDNDNDNDSINDNNNNETESTNAHINYNFDQPNNTSLDDSFDEPIKAKKRTRNKKTTANGTRYKRSVSAKTKRMVAAKQGWKCGYYAYCKRMLDETFEVDHVIPLYKGGSNDMSNLMALDPICHRKKTRADRMGIPIQDYLQRELNERGKV